MRLKSYIWDGVDESLRLVARVAARGGFVL